MRSGLTMSPRPRGAILAPRCGTPTKRFAAVGRTLAGQLVPGRIGLAWSVPLGILFGVIAAVKRNTWVDSLVTLLSIVGTTMPVFALGLFGLYVFAIVLDWVPYPAAAAGWQPAKDPAF